MHPHHDGGAEAPGHAAHVAARQKDECPGGQAEALHTRNNSNTADSTQSTAARKRITTAQATLALCGYELYQLATGPLLVLRCGQAHELPDVVAAEAFAWNLAGGSR